jgi:hypothetical protein
MSREMKKSLKTLLACALAATMVFSLAACGEKEEVVPETPDTPVVEMDPTEYVDVTTEDIVDTLIYTYGEDFNATQAIEPEVFAELTGIQPAMYDEYYAAMAPMSAHVDTVFVVKAAEGYIEEVHDLLNAYRDDLLADTMQYPMNVPKIEASIIEEYEAFVVFRMLGAMYEPETTETEATETEKVEVAEGEKTPEEKAAYDFYCAETNKGTDALIQLFDIGFTVNWTEEERMEKGIRIIEISKDNEFEVSGTEEVEATEDNEAEVTETTEAEAEVAEPTETEESEVAETESTETAEVAGEEKVDAEKVDENIAEEVVENKAEENTADGSAE